MDIDSFSSRAKPFTKKKAHWRSNKSGLRGEVQEFRDCEKLEPIPAVTGSFIIIAIMIIKEEKKCSR